jgi:DNA-binding transcriptional regulator YhcF (GntR family)
MIDPDSDRPAYRQLADKLREDILNGTLPPGAALPSEERIHQEVGLSRNTIRRAIGTLRQEGLVIVDPPRGTFVRMRGPEKLVLLEPGDSATVRVPTPAQRRQYEVPEGVPALIVERADGRLDVYPADLTRIQSSEPPPKKK